MRVRHANLPRLIPRRVCRCSTIIAWLTVVAEYRLTVLSSVVPQYTLTEPQVGQVVARRAIRRACTPVRVSVAPYEEERR